MINVEINYKFAGHCSGCGNTEPPMRLVHLRATHVQLCTICVEALINKLVESKALENRSGILVQDQNPPPAVG